ncbi:MAG: hypothetical protein JWQ11_3463 [Rhizobacter sp.]|nr:hypothetical protein [Rhizobacter sp.]
MIISEQALAGPTHPGRGPANLSAVSAPNVMLPPMGMPAQEWAALNGITISWIDSGKSNYGTAYADRRLIVMSPRLLNLPPEFREYAMYHEIGHVLAGHSERLGRPTPVWAAREIDADDYAKQAVKVTDPQTDATRKRSMAAVLETLMPDSEHRPGQEIAKALLDTLGPASPPFMFQLPIQLPLMGVPMGVPISA